MCPISPAAPRDPRRIRPPVTSPAARPVPMLRNASSASPSSSTRAPPSAAPLTAFSTTTGTPSPPAPPRQPAPHPAASDQPGGEAGPDAEERQSGAAEREHPRSSQRSVVDVMLNDDRQPGPLSEPGTEAERARPDSQVHRMGDL